MSESRRRGWTLAIVSIGLFMVVLDNLVVNVALPSIHRDLGASIQALEWTVNAYVLSYAVLLLTGAALGDRFGRKRMFMAGIALFTMSSAGAALAPSTGLLIAARAVQGVGAAIATPLTLTLLADAFPPARRGMAHRRLVGDQRHRRRARAAGRWRRRAGGLLALDLLDQRPDRRRPRAAGRRSPDREPWAERATSTSGGLALGSSGLFGLVFGLVRSQSLGWTNTEVLVSLIAGALLVIAFILHERRTENPMLPMSSSPIAASRSPTSSRWRCTSGCSARSSS